MSEPSNSDSENHSSSSEDLDGWPHGNYHLIHLAQETQTQLDEIIDYEKRLDKQCAQFDRYREAEYQAIIPPLNTPTTIPECVEAMQWIIEEAKRYWPKWVEERKKLVDKFEYSLHSMAEIENNFGACLGGPSYVEKGMMRNGELYKAAEERQKKYVRGESPREQAIKLQLAARTLMEGQSEELKKRFFKNNLAFSKHLNRLQPTRQKVIVRLKNTRGLTPEIGAMVYSHLDL